MALEEPVERGEAPPHSEITDAAPNPEEERYAKRERSRILREAIVKLRPKLRVTVEVYTLKQRSLQETAEMLGISIAATKGRLFHARTLLRRTPQIKAIANRAG